LSIEGEIGFADNCGSSIAKFDLRLTPKNALTKRTDDLGLFLLVLSNEYPLKYFEYKTIGVYLPRCEDGNHNQNSFNLNWLGNSLP